MLLPLTATFLSMLALGIALSALALGVVWTRRLRAERDEIAGRIFGLESRVSRLEEEVTVVPAAGSTASRVESREPPPGTSRRSDPAASRFAAGPTLIEVPDLASRHGGGTSSVSTPVALELGRRFGPIWELADAGASAESIARATGQPIGQVELILGLKRQSSAAGAGGGRHP